MATSSIGTVEVHIKPIIDQLEKAAEDQASSFVKREPAVLTHLVSGPAAGLATLFGTGHADKVGAQITAAVVALAIVAQGFLLRRFVAPAWKKLTGSELPSGVLDSLDPDPEPDWEPEVHEPTSQAQAERLGRPSPGQHAAIGEAGPVGPGAGA